MRKYKFFTKFSEEEQWLNDMAKQGYHFTRKLWLGYEFKQGELDGSVIKMDFRTFNRKPDFEDYLALFEDSGWIHIAGTKSSGYQYFRKVGERDEEQQEIFSDADSEAGRYKRLSSMWVTLAFSFIPIFAALCSTKAIDPGIVLHPSSLYYTPGLWDMEGLHFWRAFLFETPFALFRGALWMILPASVLLYLYFAVKAERQYKRMQDGQMFRK